MKAVDYPWYYQYAMAFYYSTATMTTVGMILVKNSNITGFFFEFF